MIGKVVITDLGEIGENAIIVFEESVGVGAEEIVANQEYVTFTDPENEVMQVMFMLNIYSYLFMFMSTSFMLIQITKTRQIQLISRYPHSNFLN